MMRPMMTSKCAFILTTLCAIHAASSQIATPIEGKSSQRRGRRREAIRRREIQTSGFQRFLEDSGMSMDLSMSMPTEDKPPRPAHLFPQPFPHTRFTAWDNLTEGEKFTAESLGYNSFSWNNFEISDLEYVMYDALTELQQTGVAALGFDRDSWDCWILHYEGLWWQQLQQAGLAQYYETLGWNEEMWNTGVGLPITEDYFWYELTEEQKHAAAQLCFNPITWDWIPLDQLN
mmetsp:Transcript_24354/g.57891  ORF Transcript_24354/g.57891 Transcript_24354/m.57891 type:complete len:232 (-) Transcript_24354:147-842(-)